MITIGIDATNLSSGGGLTHLTELLNEANPKKHGFGRIVVWGSKSTLSILGNKPWLIKCYSEALDKSLLYRIIWKLLFLSRAARTQGCDVLFVPGGSNAGRFRPFVTVSQNILPFDFNEIRRYGFSIRVLKFILLRFIQSHTFVQSDGVIFLNNYAYQKILSVTGNLSGRVAIIPHGINKRFMLASSRFYRPSSDFNEKSPCKILYVSSVEAYKHHWNVVEAVSVLRRKGFNVTLEMVGPSGGGIDKVMDAIRRFDPFGEFCRYLGVVSYEFLDDVYCDADIGIFASTCENMPITLLEYMAAGLPIACSNKGPMPQILEGCGKYFDSEDVDSIQSALIELINSEETRVRLAKSAFKVAQKYSWEKCADETFKFLAEFTQMR